MKEVIENTTTIKGELSDILLDISWAKIAKHYFGKSPSWLYHKLDGIDGNGKKADFTYSERMQFRNALFDFSERVRRAAERIDV